jgi:hypothetical protein
MVSSNDKLAFINLSDSNIILNYSSDANSDTDDSKSQISTISSTSINSFNLGTNTSSTPSNEQHDIKKQKKKHKQLEKRSKLEEFNKIMKREINQIKHAFDYNNNDEFDYYHNKIKHKQSHVTFEKRGGLSNKFVFLLLIGWYIFSGLTLFTNKYIVVSRKTDPKIIGTTQMLITSICGYYQLTSTLWKKTLDSTTIPTAITTSNKTSGFKSNNETFKCRLFWKNILIIGSLRLFSLVVGLMALKVATVSFVETVKSSSPIFTVIISKYLNNNKHPFVFII